MYDHEKGLIQLTSNEQVFASKIFWQNSEKSN